MSKNILGVFMKRILENKKIVAIIAAAIIFFVVCFGVYHNRINAYSSKLAIQIDEVEKLSENNFAPENHIKEYDHWIALAENSNDKSQLFKMMKMSKEYETKFSKDSSKAKKNEKEVTAEIDSGWGEIYLGGMLQASQSESYANKISSVWHDAIFDDSVTVDGKSYTDFNDAIKATQVKYFTEFGELDSYFDDTVTTANNVSELIKKYFPEKSDRADDIQSYALALNQFNDEALHPTGSYSNRGSKLGDLESGLLAKYNKIGSSF